MSLKAESLSFAYSQGVPVLQELSVEIPKGKITALLGRNGCGKSTLLRILNRLLVPSAGQVWLEDRRLEEYPARELAQRMAHLTQSPTAPSGLTVRELVSFGRHPYQGLLGRRSAKDREMVDWALQKTELEALQGRPLEALSGGQRQRAWIAMALAQDTEYLLLDEPTTYLDIAHQLEVLELLAFLNREEKKTVVMVVHEPNHASQYADHIVGLAAGKVLLEGPPKEIFCDPPMRSLFGVEPLLFEGPREGRPWCVPYRTVGKS